MAGWRPTSWINPYSEMRGRLFLDRASLIYSRDGHSISKAQLDKGEEDFEDGADAMLQAIKEAEIKRLGDEFEESQKAKETYCEEVK